MVSECSRPLMLKPCEAVVRAANLCREAVGFSVPTTKSVYHRNAKGLKKWDHVFLLHV